MDGIRRHGSADRTDSALCSAGAADRGRRRAADSGRRAAVKDAGGRQRLSGADRFNDAVIALKQRFSLIRLLNLWKASSEGV
jgi:hypothetical protein